jgi:Na+/H+-dicarboxylate symporter
LLGATLVSSIFFYFIANSVSFILDPGYQKNFTGWIIANTKGLPGCPPAWLFGIKFILSNALFASAFYFALMPRNETIELAIPGTQKI